ncbi:hypothetical protein C8F01DRAFT_1242531 [Mycena amicta]|nr:hypothetical protein C8F01DRAFT_1242531 [Mycena amicta]
MNGFPQPGTRVFYWDGAGKTVYGTVQTVARSSDGTVIVDIRNDNGTSIRLPATVIQKVV